jgi:HSP20 family protein
MRFLPALQAANNGTSFQSLIDNFFSDTLPELFEQGNLPRTNIAESAEDYTVQFELPGIPQDAIEVNLHEGQLTVKAERKQPEQAEGRRWHRVEQRYGVFSRTIVLPKDANPEAIEAVYQQGVLTLSIKKVPAKTPVQIKINAK